jgi:hypothetical protein
MITRQDADKFLTDLKVKIRIYGILFLDDRGKNLQALIDLEITPGKRKEIILNLTVHDYCQGPLEEKMRGILPMWIFGKLVNGKEVYIKISTGVANSSPVCISFHIAKHMMNYPFKT